MINKTFVSIIIAGLVSSFSVMAQVELPKLVSNGMVLQRDKPANIWGWADAGEKVSVSFAGQTKTTKSGDDGKWMVKEEGLTTNWHSCSLRLRICAQS